MKPFSRRAFLTGVGGVTLGLPFLESLRSPAWAANDGGPPRYAFFMRNGNGVQQADNGEPERFWPHETGTLTTALMSGRDSDRAVSELAGYADQLTLVNGTRFPFSSTTCGHTQGGNQCLTAARINDETSHLTLALGESVDNLIARSFPNNGGEPLTLYTGPRSGYLEEVLSYRGSEDLRSAEDDPWNAYQRMVGADGTLDQLLGDRRRSVNDLVREQMQALLRRDLSARDRQRLDLHFQAIRDFEELSCRLSEDEEQAMASMLGLGTLNDNRLTVAQMHLDLVALAFSCDFVRAATLQMGDGNDGTEYTVNGTRLPRFHHISHRIYSDGADGDPIPNADLLHHEIDRLHAQTFRHLLDRLSEFGVLEQSIAVWTNDLGAGVSHTYRNIPWVLAGSGGGALQTGQYVDLGGERPHAHLLSTIASAVGVTKDDGSPIDDFGDPSTAPGRIDEILA
ncbi:MAG: DUF1552 domain-containing protein [Myxococcota bacterium]